MSNKSISALIMVIVFILLYMGINLQNEAFYIPAISLMIGNTLWNFFF
ncbi:hypothetical protein [Natranaerobius trueperi]|nr:hypothetical protein [Natranaerobius trueperi]